MIVLTFGGYSLNHVRTLPDADATAIEGLRAIHALGILHGDVARRNMLWDAKEQRVIWHDFGRAKNYRRSPLTEKSVNRMTISGVDKKTKGDDPQRKFSREILRAFSELKPNRPLHPRQAMSVVSRGNGMAGKSKV